MNTNPTTTYTLVLTTDMGVEYTLTYTTFQDCDTPFHMSVSYYGGTLEDCTLEGELFVGGHMVIEGYDPTKNVLLGTTQLVTRRIVSIHVVDSYTVAA